METKTYVLLAPLVKRTTQSDCVEKSTSDDGVYCICPLSNSMYGAINAVNITKIRDVMNSDLETVLASLSREEYKAAMKALDNGKFKSFLATIQTRMLLEKEQIQREQIQ